MSPIQKGSEWGSPGAFPDDGVIVRSDAEARRVVEEARRKHLPPPTLGLLGGDLCRTLGGGENASDDRGGEGRLRSVGGVRFPVDLGEVLLDGRLHLFVAHCVARNRWWTRAVVAMNAQWLDGWNLGPRAHPGDGLLDIYEARLPLRQLPAVRARLRHGAHLPHPGIKERRAPAAQFDLDPPLPVQLDGEFAGTAHTVSVRVQPDALVVVV
jgi:hypothetical protein